MLFSADKLKHRYFSWPKNNILRVCILNAFSSSKSLKGKIQLPTLKEDFMTWVYACISHTPHMITEISQSLYRFCTRQSNPPTKRLFISCISFVSFFFLKQRMNYLLPKREENQRKCAKKAGSPGNRMQRREQTIRQTMEYLTEVKH